MEMLKDLKGQNGVIYIYPDYIEISRKTLGGFISQGGSTGNRRIYYSDINAVEYKTPTKMTNGYIKIIVGGTSDTKASPDFSPRGLREAALCAINVVRSTSYRTTGARPHDDTV